MFYNKYRDLQIYFIKNSFGATVNGNTIVNAAQAKTQGFELQVTALPVDNFKINAARASTRIVGYAPPREFGATIRYSCQVRARDSSLRGWRGAMDPGVAANLEISSDVPPVPRPIGHMRPAPARGGATEDLS